MTLFLRVDDYPFTKPEEADRHTLARFMEFYRVVTKVGRFPGFHLGIIPKHVTDADLKVLGQTPGIWPALHGLEHDERFPNEFREYLTKDQVKQRLSEGVERLEKHTGMQVDCYIPPHNVLDRRTFDALRELNFKRIMVGPGFDERVLLNPDEWNFIAESYPPSCYGRSDELLANPLVVPTLQKMSKSDGKAYLGLHFTWENNIGFEHLDRFLEAIFGG